MSAYARENMLGPSIYTEYVEETLAPLVKSNLPSSELDDISFKNKGLQSALLKHFQRDGEQVYHRSQFLIFLFAAEHILHSKNKDTEQTCDVGSFAKLWRARLSFWLD